MLPVVSIIGRPNVGKSTLFNRLVGRRVAITEDTPGVTRDRLYHEAEWQNHHFLLMDTGGLEFDKKDKIAREIEFQVEIAVETSDLIIFLVDGRAGLTPLDRVIAEKLHKTGNKVLLAINKIDTIKQQDAMYEFYELGTEHMHIISSEQGLGLGDMLDTVIELLPEQSEHSFEDEALKIAIIGKPNVGKSSLVNRLLNEQRMIVSDIPGTTRDSIDTYYERNGKKYVLIDTAGIRRQRSIVEKVERYSVLRTYDAIDRAEVCLFLIDATEGVTEQDTKIIGYAHDNHKASIIAVNKWDLIDKDNSSTREFEIKIRTKLAFMPYAPLIFISVKTGQRVDKLFSLIDKIDENYSFRVRTGVLNEIVRDAVAMSPPPTDKGNRLKIYYATQVATRPPKILFYVNDPEMMHFSYLRYLENQIRRNFPWEGVPILFDVRKRRMGDDS